MKNIITALILLLSFSSFSQERGEAREERSSEEMATLMAKRVSMQLDLNEEQQTKLKALYLKGIEERKEMRTENREERAEMREERQDMMEKYQEQMKQILTEEQFNKFKELQEKRRRGRQRGN